MENNKTGSRKYFEWFMNPLFGFIATRRNIVKRDIYPGSNQLNKNKMEKQNVPFRQFADAIKDMENPKDSYTVEGKVFKEGDSVYGTWVDYDGSTHYQQGVIIKNEVTGLWLDNGGGITEIKRFIFLNKNIEPVKPPHNPNYPTPFA